MELLSQIPFRHEEKIKRVTLVSRLRKELLTKAWKELSHKIKSEKIEYQKLAENTIKIKSP